MVWRAADRLRGIVAEQTLGECLLALVLLRHASETQRGVDGDSKRLIVPESAKFERLLALRDPDEMVVGLSGALADLERQNTSRLGGIFSHLRASIDGAARTRGFGEALAEAIKLIGFAETNAAEGESELSAMQRAVELLMASFATSSAERQGEIYTPSQVAKLLAEVTSPSSGDVVYDPVCGTAGFLVSAAEYVRLHHPNARIELVGQELAARPSMLAALNVFLNGLDERGITRGDSLCDPITTREGALRRYDVVVGNPPYSMPRSDADLYRTDLHRRFRYGVPPPGRADYAFIQLMIASTKPDTGRMAVIVPHGVLFRGGSEGAIRKQLIEHNMLDAIVGLPPKLFYNTAIPTAMLYFRHGRTDDSIMFVDASRGYESDRRLNRLRDQDIARIVDTLRRRATIAEYSNLVGREQVRENEFNLNIRRYVGHGNQPARSVDDAELAERENALTAELADLQRQIRERMREVGVHVRKPST